MSSNARKFSRLEAMAILLEEHLKQVMEAHRLVGKSPAEVRRVLRGVLNPPSIRKNGELHDAINEVLAFYAHYGYLPGLDELVMVTAL